MFANITAGSVFLSTRTISSCDNIGCNGFIGQPRQIDANTIDTK